MTVKEYSTPRLTVTEDVKDVILTSGFDTPDDNFGEDEDEGVETPIVPGNPTPVGAYEF